VRSPYLSLAQATPGTRYRVVGLLFRLVRDRCHACGCTEGSVLTCLSNDAREVRLALRNGPTTHLEREYAWFVQVKRLADPPTR
jgi:hypothetical protein